MKTSSLTRSSRSASPRRRGFGWNSLLIAALSGFACAGSQAASSTAVEHVVIGHAVAGDADVSDETPREQNRVTLEVEEAATADAREATPPNIGDVCRDGACMPEGTVEFTPKDLRRIRRILPYIAAASARYGVDPALVSGVIWVESRYFTNAKGPAGAQGVMQLMPVTSASLAKLMDTKDAPWNPRFNVMAGTLFLSRLLSGTDGDEVLALAAYSRGLPRVRRWNAKGHPLPSGTRGYIGKVQRAKQAFAEAYANGTLRLPTPKHRRRKEMPQEPLALRGGSSGMTRALAAP